MTHPPTPGQTVGPSSASPCRTTATAVLVPPTHPRRGRLHGRVLDGHGPAGPGRPARGSGGGAGRHGAAGGRAVAARRARSPAGQPGVDGPPVATRSRRCDRRRGAVLRDHGLRPRPARPALHRATSRAMPDDLLPAVPPSAGRPSGAGPRARIRPRRAGCRRGRPFLRTRLSVWRTLLAGDERAGDHFSQRAPRHDDARGRGGLARPRPRRRRRGGRPWWTTRGGRGGPAATWSSRWSGCCARPTPDAHRGLLSRDVVDLR